MEHDTTTPAGLKSARKALGLRQAALAELLGLHVVTVSRMETGAPGYPIEPRTALAVECLLHRAAIEAARRQH